MCNVNAPCGLVGDGYTDDTEALMVEIRVAPTSRWYKITDRSGCLPKLYDVVERVRDADGQGRRTDTVTGDLVRAIRRRDEMRRQGRPAYVTDAGGRRIEVSW